MQIITWLLILYMTLVTVFGTVFIVTFIRLSREK